MSIPSLLSIILSLVYGHLLGNLHSWISCYFRRFSHLTLTGSLMLPKCLSPLLSCKTSLKCGKCQLKSEWESTLKFLCAQMPMQACMHVCMYVCNLHVCIHLYTCICMWHVCSLKPKILKGDQPDEQRPKNHTVSHGACSLASLCYKELQSSITTVARTYQIWWTITLLLRERHMGRAGR